MKIAKQEGGVIHCGEGKDPLPDLPDENKNVSARSWSKIEVYMNVNYGIELIKRREFWLAGLVHALKAKDILLTFSLFNGARKCLFLRNIRRNLLPFHKEKPTTAFAATRQKLKPANCSVYATLIFTYMYTVILVHLFLRILFFRVTLCCRQ